MRCKIADITIIETKRGLNIDLSIPLCIFELSF